MAVAMEKQQVVTVSGEMDSALDKDSAQVVGTTSLYENGQIRCIPMPTPDPKGKEDSNVAPETASRRLARQTH